MKFFDYNLTTDTAEKQLLNGESQETVVVGCLNPHSFVTAEEDAEFKRALQRCTMLIPDGEGICMMLKRYKHTEVKKFAGDDLHNKVLAELEAMGGKIFYLGSRQEVLDKIAARVRREYPHVSVGTHSPSYCAAFSDEENAEMVRQVNEFAPDVLMVGMTAPKQEKWIEAHRGELRGVKLIGAIGAVFEFYAGTVKRAPQWAIRLKMEWLFRLVKEPKRMWQRNFVSTPRYLKYVKRNHSKM